MSDSVKHGLLAAYRKFMRPLVRILIRHGISINEFNEVLKAVYAEVAESDFSLPGRRQSQSRVAILTGLTRKEVARLKSTDFGRNVDANKKDVHRVARVLDGWHLDPAYTGPYGMPMEVPFEASSGISFTDLVRRYSGDMAPRAMLDELLRVGAAREIDNGWIRVLNRSYIPESLASEALERTANVIENFVNTVEINLKKERAGAGRFERIVLSDHGLSEDQLIEFDTLLRRRGQQLLEELDDWLSAQDAIPGEKVIMTGVGIYHFIEAPYVGIESHARRADETEDKNDKMDKPAGQNQKK